MSTDGKKKNTAFLEKQAFKSPFRTEMLSKF